MSLPDLYISKPGVSFPANSVSNEETLRRVQRCFRGSESAWLELCRAIERTFAECNTQQRFIGESEATPASAAIEAAHSCLRENRTALERVDLVVHGSVTRQYFEPATAMEVAGKLGLSRTHAFDVNAGPAGHLEAIQAALGYLRLHQNYDAALVTTSELCANFVDYDLQSTADLQRKAAGLSLGDAAASVLVSRQPWPGGCLQLLKMRAHVRPEAWEVAQIPVDGPLRTRSHDLERLGKLLPPLLIGDLAEVGWLPTDVDHFIFHQPSEAIVRHILEEIGADPSRGVYSHRHYGNTASAAIAVTLHQLLRERDLRPGDKVALVGGSLGIASLVATGVWTRGGATKN